MFGNLINNSLIKELINDKQLVITPIDLKLLQLAQYPLRPLVVWEVKAENEGRQIHYFTEKDNKFILKPKSYYWIDVNESIKLPIGIVGRFMPSSNLIEKGISLTAGKIENPFGDNGERIRFGIYNFLDNPATIEFKTRIAYIQFMDLRGMDNHEYKMTKYDKQIYGARRPDDDGPNYERDNQD
jgi:deoxycytidine triphosphate deaminase